MRQERKPPTLSEHIQMNYKKRSSYCCLFSGWGFSLLESYSATVEKKKRFCIPHLGNLNLSLYSHNRDTFVSLALWLENSKMSKPHSEKPSGESMPRCLRNSKSPIWPDGESWGGAAVVIRCEIREAIRAGDSLASHCKNLSIYTVRDGNLLKRFEEWMDINTFLKELLRTEREK